MFVANIVCHKKQRSRASTFTVATPIPLRPSTDAFLEDAFKEEHFQDQEGVIQGGGVQGGVIRGGAGDGVEGADSP